MTIHDDDYYDSDDDDDDDDDDNTCGVGGKVGGEQALKVVISSLLLTLFTLHYIFVINTIIYKYHPINHNRHHQDHTCRRVKKKKGRLQGRQWQEPTGEPGEAFFGEISEIS